LIFINICINKEKMAERATGGIGFWPAAALVAGNMIGSGIFLLPAALSVFGGYSLIGWGISTVGAILLALTFAALSRRRPLTGGPYAYTREAFGPFSGFLVAWGYWISLWSGNAAIAVAFIASLTPFFPVLGTAPALAAGCCIASVWFATWLNLRGVKEASYFQLVTTILRLAPILLVATVGFYHFDAANLSVAHVKVGWLDAALQTAALTLWSFLGIESATVPAGDIRNPEKNIARATIAGTIFSAIIFVAASTAVLGAITPGQLEQASAPFALAAGIMWGNAGYYLVAAAAAIACLGALNGWILLQGQIPWAAAADGIFPRWFAHKNRRGAPDTALIVSSVLITVMVVFNYSKTLQQQFQQMILLATLSSLIPYLFCAIAAPVLAHKGDFKRLQGKHWHVYLLAAFTTLFSIAAIIGTGWLTVAYGLALLAAGVPVYFFMVNKK
jgi:APA family basic amino acid/polyamine antiporter